MKKIDDEKKDNVLMNISSEEILLEIMKMNDEYTKKNEGKKWA